MRIAVGRQISWKKYIYNYLCTNVVIYEDELQLGMMFPTHLWLAILWYNMLASDPGIPLPPQHSRSPHGHEGSMSCPKPQTQQNPSNDFHGHKIHLRISWPWKPMQWTLQPEKSWRLHVNLNVWFQIVGNCFSTEVTSKKNSQNMRAPFQKQRNSGAIWFKTRIQMSCTSQSACKHKLIKYSMDPRSFGDLIARTLMITQIWANGHGDILLMDEILHHLGCMKPYK